MTPGIDLAAAFYAAAVAPLLADQRHAAALLGDGSEVLGYDDPVSTDHDFGPRVQLFVPADDAVRPVLDRLVGLPTVFGGFPVRYADTKGSGVVHHVAVTTAARFFTDRLRVDPGAGMTVTDWLLTPTHIMAGLTAGAVFHDPDGEIARRRDALRWYPDDVWRFALAAGWLRVGQEESFVGRAGSTGDDLGSRILAARLVRELMRLAFLVERRFAPYGKWFGRAFGELAVGRRIRPHLDVALAAPDWRGREAGVVGAASLLIDATNALGLCVPVDPAPRPFHDRDLTVVDAERLTVALTDAITDAELRRVFVRVGNGSDTAVSQLPGTIDQAVDSTDLLTVPERFRAASALIGLAP